MTTAPDSALERYGFIALAASLGLIQLTIFGAEILLSAAALLWLALAWRERVRPAVPAFFIPLVALAAWTLVSAVFSSDPMASVYRSRQLLLYFVVPITMRLAAGPRAARVVDVIVALGAVGALVGVVEYTALGFDHLEHRPRGLLGHYMTYSGVLMLVICAALARLVYRGAEWVWPAVAVPALVVALAFTESRNAWVGAAAAIVCLFALRNWKLLIALPVIIVVGFAIAPAQLRHRALSIVDPNDPSTRDRLEMLTAGQRMITDHPLTGVGPNMVPIVYPHYRTPQAQPLAAHLHNVPVQLAAERGLPALAAWSWFLVIAARDLFRLARRGSPPKTRDVPSLPRDAHRAIAAAGLAALVAMFTAGLFEHNFGDSEFLILFLGLITLPFAAERNGLSQPAEARRAA